MTDAMTDELNRAVEQNLNPGTAKGRLVGADRGGVFAGAPVPSTLGDVIRAMEERAEGLKQHIDTVIRDLQDLKAKL